MLVNANFADGNGKWEVEQGNGAVAKVENTSAGPDYGLIVLTTRNPTFRAPTVKTASRR